VVVTPLLMSLILYFVGRWVANREMCGFVGSAPACFGSSPGSNPDISQKYKIIKHIPAYGFAKKESEKFLLTESIATLPVAHPSRLFNVHLTMIDITYMTALEMWDSAVNSSVILHPKS
jgi:hypothetical protein